MAGASRGEMLVLALVLSSYLPVMTGIGAGHGEVPPRLRAGLIPPPLMAPSLCLRGGCAVGATADTAATEEQEQEQAVSLKMSAPNSTTVPTAQPTGTDQLREHLQTVEANPGDFIAHPEPGSLRFKVCDAAILARKPRGIASATTEIRVTRRRNVWQRFYPLDLATLLSDVLDTAEVFDEEGEMGAARTLATTGAAPSGAISSTVSPWAWATQTVTFSDGSQGTARLLFAQESTGVIMWSLQRGSEEPIVERVHISEELGATHEGTKVSITWTSVRMEALKQLPDVAGAGNAEAFERAAANDSHAAGTAAAATPDDDAEGENRVMNALLRLKTIMGVGEQAPSLQLKPFSIPPLSSETVPGDGGGGGGGGFKTLVLDHAKNVWKEQDFCELKIGDVVKVLKTQSFPGDVLLLHSSSPTEVCVETSCFDMDTALRHWQCVPAALSAHDLHTAAQGNKSAPTLLDALGNGDSSTCERLRAADMTFKIQPCRLPAEWEAWQALLLAAPHEAAKGVENVTFGYRQLLPFRAKLLVTDWVVGVVMFLGNDTSFALSGGASGCQRQARRLELQKKHEADVKETAKLKHFAAEATRAPLDAAELEFATKIKWRSCFTDVPDDGNCLMHAVWLGLTSLLKMYPHLALPDEPPLPTSATAFRAQAIARMGKDPDFRDAVGNQLMLWVSVECDLLFGLEDFFCLPPEFQSRVVELNQQVQMGGMDPSLLDMAQLVDDYISALSQEQVDGNR